MFFSSSVICTQRSINILAKMLCFSNGEIDALCVGFKMYNFISFHNKRTSKLLFKEKCVHSALLLLQQSEDSRQEVMENQSLCDFGLLCDVYNTSKQVSKRILCDCSCAREEASRADDQEKRVEHLVDELL